MTRTNTLTAALVGLTAIAATACAPSVEPAEPSPPVPVVEPQPSAPVIRDVGSPERVVIPAIGVDERLGGVGLMANGDMEMPAFGDTAWYDEGPRPGASGPAVVVAHVRGPDGADVFADLGDLAVGDTVTTFDSLGSTTFVVERIEQVGKEALPYDRIWTDSDDVLLRLITCAGTPGPQGFPDNTVVYARAR